MSDLLCERGLEVPVFPGHRTCGGAAIQHDLIVEQLGEIANDLEHRMGRYRKHNDVT